jgi:hypothetical protein
MRGSHAFRWRNKTCTVDSAGESSVWTTFTHGSWTSWGTDNTNPDGRGRLIYQHLCCAVCTVVVSTACTIIIVPHVHVGVEVGIHMRLVITLSHHTLLVCHAIAHHRLAIVVHLCIARVERLDRFQPAGLVHGVPCRVSSIASHLKNIARTSSILCRWVGRFCSSFVVRLTFISSFCGRLRLVVARLGIRGSISGSVRRLAVTLWKNTFVSYCSNRGPADWWSRLWWEMMKSTYVGDRSTLTARTRVCVLNSRTKASMTAIPHVSLRMRSSLIGRKTSLVLVLEIILGELVHHLGICSRLIISTHRVEPVVVVSIATTHAIPSAITAIVVHGRHVVHAHAHVSTIVAVHAVHVVEVYSAVSGRFVMQSIR